MVTYDVVTDRERFVQYLTDAKKLFLKVVAADKDVGFASVDRLTRIFDGISEESAIVDEEGNHVGEIVYALEYVEKRARPTGIKCHICGEIFTFHHDHIRLVVH